MSPTTYLITGGNRGIGRGLVETLVQRPNSIVIAGVRDPNHSTSKDLSSLHAASGSKVIVVKIDSLSDNSSRDAVHELSSKHGITKLDTVVANAGIAKYYGSAAETPLSELREHFEVNVVGVLALFQAVFPLLEKSSKPIFVIISSPVASIGDIEKVPLPATAYGISKASINYLARKIHFENPNLIAFPLSPGWVQTDMGNLGAVNAGLKEAPTTLKESVDGIVSKLDSATKEKTSGNFEAFDDGKWSW